MRGGEGEGGRERERYLVRAVRRKPRPLGVGGRRHDPALGVVPRPASRRSAGVQRPAPPWRCLGPAAAAPGDHHAMPVKGPGLSDSVSAAATVISGSEAPHAESARDSEVEPLQGRGTMVRDLGSRWFGTLLRNHAG